MKRLDYIDLFTKKVIGSISNKEKELLDNLSNDPESKKDIESLQDIWDNSANYSPKFSFNSSKAFEKFKYNNINTAESASFTSKNIFSKLIIGFISLSVLTILFVFLYNTMDNNSSDESRSVKNYTMNGTEVWLNKNAKLSSAKSKAGEEVIKVDGFVYLDNSQSNELIIEELDQNIVLKRAKASIYKDGDKGLEISIEEGSASLVVNNENVEIKSGESLQLNALGQIKVGKVKSNNIFTWRINTLQFNNTPMDVVIGDLELYYGIVINSKVSGLEDCFFTSPILTNTEINTVFEILQSSHKAEFSVVEGNSNHYDLTSINCL